MSRRSGQTGYEEKSGKWYVVRFWKDVEGQEKRQNVREKICPISGPGKLSASERLRKRREIIAASGADTVEHFDKAVRSIHGITFREQAAIWLDQMRNRRRKPVVPETLYNWENHLDKWINPFLGDMPLDAVNNLAMKQFVAKMIASGELGPKSINNYTQVVKRVVASAINDEGERIYPRQWNHEFIDMPEIKNQKQPSFTGEIVTGIIAINGRARRDAQQRSMFFTLCGAAGLRFGEALGIDIRDISPDFATIKIHQKVRRGRLENFL
jgi:integrase